MSSVDELPVGTVTFLFTDIEGSTRLLRQLGGERYGEALEEHQRILREAFAENGGREIDTQGDSFFVAFRRAKDAVATAIECQRRLAAHPWPDGVELRVRMGIHTGEPAMGGERYVGMGVHRAARICAAGHGGQVLLSQTTRELLRDDPIPDVGVRDLGEHQLKDMDEPEHVFQLVATGLRVDFPALKTAAAPPFEGRESELAAAATEEITRGWRRPGRRAVVGATLAAALVGLGIGVLLTVGGGSNASASVTANAVGVVDPESGQIAAEIPVGVAPSGVAAGTDSLWVTNAGENTVTRVDLPSNEVRQTIQVGQGPLGVAVTANAVWVANGLRATVSRIDPQTNRVSQTIDVGNGPTGVAAGEGAVWVTNSTDGTVSRIDPRSGRVTGTFPAAAGAAAIAIGFGRVWIVSPPAGSLVVLDPRSGRTLDEIGVGVDPSAAAIGEDAVWVANRADGTVSKIEPRTGAVIGTVGVGRRPTGVAAGRDVVWVANGGDATLSRVDPRTVTVEKVVPLGNPPRDVLLRPQGAYVTVGSNGAEHRGGTLSVVTTAPDVIDPALAYNPVSWGALAITNDGLVAFRKVGGVQGTQLVPDLATSLPVLTDGGRTHTFQVRQGIRYSTGKLVQPEDFRRALERVFELGSAGAGYYAGIVGADRCRKGRPCDLSRGVVADRAARTVVFKLSAADGDFLSKLAMPWAYAVPASTPSRAIGTRPVPATGPYRIAAYSTMTKVIRLVRNPEFREWSPDAQPAGFPDSISITWTHGFENTSARVRDVERGTADIALLASGPVSKDVLDRLAAQYPGRLKLSPAFLTAYFFLNVRIPPFDDVRVRRAVSNAFDPQAYAETLGPDHAPTCRVLPPNFPGYQSTCLYAGGGIDAIDRARRQVTAAGAAGAPVTVWMLSSIADRGRYMASLLRSIGFEADVKLKPNPSVYSDAVADPKNRAQIGFYVWLADYPSAAGFIPPILGCAAVVPASPELNTNLSGFCDPSIDARMARAKVLQATNPPEATLLWQRIERELLARAPLLPTDNRQNTDFLSTRVGNYQYNPQWGVLLSQAWVR